MEKQMSNAKNVRTLMLPELLDDNMSSLLLPQLQANNWLMPVKSAPTSDNKRLWHQLPHSSDVVMIHLVPIDCVPSLGTSSATDSKFTTRRKPIWKPLLPL
jgi:hypothetical protein